MPLDKTSFALSLVAVAAAGYAAWTAQSASHDLRAQQEQNGVLAQRLADAEAALAAPKAPAAQPPPPAAASATRTDAGLAGRAPAGDAPAAANVEARIAALEKSEAEFRKAMSAGSVAIPGDRDVIPPVLPMLGDAPLRFEMPRIYGSPEDAAKHLDLSPSQKAEFERVAADAKRDLEDLKKVPDETGKTWTDVAKETFSVGEGGVFSFNDSKLREFREKTVPGRGESFGAAERRIRDGAKSRLRSGLTADQQAKFDKAMVDPMLGSADGGASMIISSVEVSSPIPAPAPSK